MNNYEFIKNINSSISELEERGVINPMTCKYFCIYKAYLKNSDKIELSVEFDVSVRTINRAISFMEFKTQKRL